MYTIHLPEKMLVNLLTGYDKMVADQVGDALPSPVNFLTEHNGTNKLIPLLAEREALEQKVETFERILYEWGFEIPTLDRYAIDIASDKVSTAFLKFKEAELAKGAEIVFENSYTINIAANIAYFFEAYWDSAFAWQDEVIHILFCSLQDNFFEKIMKFAVEATNFDVSNLEATTSEISGFCEDTYAECT